MDSGCVEIKEINKRKKLPFSAKTSILEQC